MQDTQVKRFNLRVYALIIRDRHILISEETLNGFHFVKFPGGGVEYGEGLIEALTRELHEEGRIELMEFDHFYTTDFFQRSAFVPSDQLISVYYRCKAVVEWDEYESEQSGSGRQHEVKLRFIALNELSPDLFTFPLDRLVAEKLLK